MLTALAYPVDKAQAIVQRRTENARPEVTFLPETVVLHDAIPPRCYL